MFGGVSTTLVGSEGILPLGAREMIYSWTTLYATPVKGGAQNCRVLCTAVEKTRNYSLWPLHCSMPL